MAEISAHFSEAFFALVRTVPSQMSRPRPGGAEHSGSAACKAEDATRRNSSIRCRRRRRHVCGRCRLADIQYLWPADCLQMTCYRFPLYRGAAEVCLHLLTEISPSRPSRALEEALRVPELQRQVVGMLGTDGNLCRMCHQLEATQCHTWALAWWCVSGWRVARWQVVARRRRIVACRTHAHSEGLRLRNSRYLKSLRTDLLASASLVVARTGWEAEGIPAGDNSPVDSSLAGHSPGARSRGSLSCRRLKMAT